MPAALKVDGAAELRRALKRVGVETGTQILGDALDKGAEVFLAAIVARAPVGKTGNLKNGFRKRKRTVTRGARGLLVRAGVQQTKQGSHAMLVEFGHRIVVGGRATRVRKNRRGGRIIAGTGGRVVGQVPAHPFIRPAFQAAAAQVDRMIETDLWRGLERRWGR